MRGSFRRLGGHTVFTSHLPSRPVVIDLGMHQGDFSGALERIRPRARVFGVEPQPELARMLSAKYGRNVIQAVVAAKGGDEAELSLFDAADMATIRSPAGERQARKTVGTVRVPIVSLSELRQRWNFDLADLIKVDIEGAEIELLAAGPAAYSFAQQISVEFHLWRYPSDAIRAAAIIDQFRVAGWRVQDFSRVLDDVLFLNPDLTVGATTVHRARLTMGAARKAGRLVQRASGAR